MISNEINLLITYINDILYNPESASIDSSSFSDETKPLAEKIEFLARCINEAYDFSNALAEGDIDKDYYIYNNVLAAPLKSIQSNLRHLAWAASRVTSGDYNQKIHNLGSLSKAFSEMTAQLEHHNNNMEKQINTDYLTGVGNRRYYNNIAKALWDSGKGFSIAYVDIDGLKVCNDKCGHNEGDNYIISVSRVLESICTEGEYVFRAGGDEFLFLSETATEEELNKRLELAKTEFCCNYTVETGDKPVSYFRNFSYGCIFMNPFEGKTQSEFLSIVDQKMYNNKLVNYMKRKQENMKIDKFTEHFVNKTGLDSRLFDVLDASSQNQYIFLCNMDTNISRWSPRIVRDFDLPDEYMHYAEHIWLEKIHPEDREIFTNDLDAVFSGRKPYHDVKYRAKTKDGNYVICSCTGGILKGHNDDPTLFAGTITNHGIVNVIDPITNMYNVYEFLKQITTLKNNSKGINILAIGLQQFSNINNMYGYPMGNKVLFEIAHQIQSLIHDKAQLFRLDGVKFAIIFNDSSQGDINHIYKEITSIGRNDINILGTHIPLNISGASLILEKLDVDENTILAKLTHALSLAKQERLGKLYDCFGASSSSANEEILLFDALRNSVLSNCEGFYLQYQPIIDADMNMIGAEALLRWEDSKYGIIPPSKFIPFLENDTSFYELGLWILRSAIHETKKILKYKPDFMLNVNISYTQMEHYGFFEDVMEILESENYPTKNLTLELTEHCQTIAPSILKQSIEYFKSKGIRIAADDFGTGYSSFSIMKQMPFDCIKIDQSFISGILDEPGDQAMVEAIILCAHKLGIHVCIEGVENKEVLDFIKPYNVDYYQGYLFEKPVSISTILKMLNE